MSIKIMEMVWKADIKPSQKMVLLCLADNANSDGVCWPSQESISKRCSTSRTSVFRCLGELEKLGYISRFRRQKTTKRMSDLYQINVIKLLDIQHDECFNLERFNLEHTEPECFNLKHPNVSDCNITYMNRHIEPSLYGDEEKISEKISEEITEKKIEIQNKKNIPCEEIVSLYHEVLHMLPKVKILTDQRKKLIRSRWEDRKKEGKYKTIEEGMNYWRTFFEYVEQSSFLTGGTDDFIADLEWMVRPTNFAKIIEGRYHRNCSR